MILIYPLFMIVVDCYLNKINEYLCIDQAVWVDKRDEANDYFFILLRCASHGEKKMVS